jgi:acyl carrier protein
MESKIKEIFSDVFLIEINSISPETSQNDLAEWDSIGHLNLVTALEEEFNITFTEENILEMLNFQLVCLIVDEVINLNNK